MRVADRIAPDYGIYGLLDCWQNFWQNGFLTTSPLEGESENRHVYTYILVGLGGLEPPTSPLSGGWGDRGLRNDSRIRSKNGEQNRRVLCTIVTRSARLAPNLKHQT